MQHAAAVRPQDVRHPPGQVDGRLELVLEIAALFRVGLARLVSECAGVGETRHGNVTET
jgi:hypothetical protein